MSIRNRVLAGAAGLVIAGGVIASAPAAFATDVPATATVGSTLTLTLTNGGVTGGTPKFAFGTVIPGNPAYSQNNSDNPDVPPFTNDTAIAGVSNNNPAGYSLTQELNADGTGKAGLGMGASTTVDIPGVDIFTNNYQNVGGTLPFATTAGGSTVTFAGQSGVSGGLPTSGAGGLNTGWSAGSSDYYPMILGMNVPGNAAAGDYSGSVTVLLLGNV